MAINVDDLPAALGFYVDVLGFVQLPRPDFGFPGAWLDTGTGQQIHLMEFPGEARSPSQHWAFGVDDLDEVMAVLDAVPYPYRGGGGTVGAGRQLFVADPSGNRIEFNQPD